MSTSTVICNILRSKLDGHKRGFTYAIFSLGLIGLFLFPIIASNLDHIRYNTLIKQSWPLGRLQEYVLRNSHNHLNVPVQWVSRVDYQSFNDVIVVHLPNVCALPDCIQETKTLLQEVSEANPDSTLAKRASNVVLGFKVLQIQ